MQFLLNIYIYTGSNPQKLSFQFLSCINFLWRVFWWIECLEALVSDWTVRWFNQGSLQLPFLLCSALDSGRRNKNTGRFCPFGYSLATPTQMIPVHG